MTFSIFLHPKANTALDKLDKTIQTAVKKKIKELKESPDQGERLAGSEFWKIRAGDYRIIYEIHTKTEKVIILYIGHRKNVYDEFSRMI
jgi:mRNA interferase RelE/StbE